jgi:hypothetical protein
MGMVTSPLGCPLDRLIGPMGNPMDIRDHWHQIGFILMLAPLFVAQFGKVPLGVAIGAMQRPMGLR